MKYALAYGALSGIVIVAVLISGIAFPDQLGFLQSVWLGYLVMLVALTFVFVGVKRYRDVDRGGVIKFLPALAVGLGIALVASLVYVIAWEAYDSATHHVFIDHYVAGLIRGYRESGMTGDKLASHIAELEKLRVQYRDPLFRIPMTFTEIFPVGLVMAIVSAALLRNPRILPARAPS